MRTYSAPGGSIQAEDVIDGVPIDPLLPERFDDTPNDRRPRSHQVWWRVPFVQRCTMEKTLAWLKAWPDGTRYDVRCLDGGAWDRSTWWGSFATQAEAIACAKGRVPSYFIPLATLEVDG